MICSIGKDETGWIKEGDSGNEWAWAKMRGGDNLVYKRRGGQSRRLLDVYMVLKWL